MAQITEIEQSTPGPTLLNGAEPEKRKPGRPKGSKKAKPPDPIEEDSEEPTDLSAADPWLRLKNRTPDEWNFTLAYLYRLGPTIDRRGGGRKISIATYARPFDQDDIMKEHGSGAYRVDLLEQDPQSGRYSRVEQFRFDILNVDYPPKVPIGDWVNDPANEVWKWAGEWPQGQQATDGKNGMYPPGFNIKEMYDTAFSVAEKFQANGKKDDSNDKVILTALLAKALKDPPPPPAPAADANDKFIQMLLDDRKAMQKEMAELRTLVMNRAEPKSVVEQLTELEPVVEKFVERFQQRSGNKGIWEGIAEKAMDSLPDVIGLVKDGMSRSAPQQTQPQPGLSGPAPALPQPQAQAQQPAPQAQPTGTPEEQQQKHLEEMFKKWQGHILQISGQLVDHFKRFSTGFDFRDWYLESWGRYRWNDLTRDLPMDMLFSILAQHPALSVELQPQEKLHQFLQDFYIKPGEEPEGTVMPDPDDEDQPSNVTPMSPRGGAA